MKLSEKGYLKIGNSIVGWFENGVAKVTFDPDKIEFNPEDFTGSVVLTAEEAEALMTFFDTMKPQMPNGGCMEYCDLWGNTIKKRIEQAEKKK